MKIDIMKIKGLDKKVFSIIAPYAMNPVVLYQLDNYPIKTSEHHVWYLAYSDGKLLGFLSVESLDTAFSIQDLYILETYRGKNIEDSLFKNVVKDFEESPYMKATYAAQGNNVNMLKNLGFEITGSGKKWFRMTKTKKNERLRGRPKKAKNII